MLTATGLPYWLEQSIVGAAPYTLIFVLVVWMRHTRRKE